MASVPLLAEPVETLLERLISHRDLDEDNSGLPKHITGLPGHMSLVADFAEARSHEPVPVYLINQTAVPVKLKAQALDYFINFQNWVFSFIF